MHVEILGIPSPTIRGLQNHLFRPLRNLTATCTAYIFRMKHDIHNRASACVGNEKGSSTSSQNDMNFTPQTAYNWTVIFTLYSLPGFADGDQQTELGQTLPNGGQ